MKLKFTEPQNILIELIIGIFIFLIGVFITLNRKKFTEAMTVSNKVFWEKLDFFQIKGQDNYLSKIMITIIGIVFLISGFISILRIIYFFLRK